MSAGRGGPPVAARGGGVARLTGARAGRAEAAGAQLSPGPSTRPAPRASAGSADYLVRNCAPGAAARRRRALRSVLRSRCSARPPRRHGRARGQWNSSKSARTNPAFAWGSRCGEGMLRQGATRRFERAPCPRSGGLRLQLATLSSRPGLVRGLWGLASPPHPALGEEGKAP